MRDMKRLRELPDFRDPEAVVEEKEDSVTHLPLIEIRYGARDEDGQQVSPEAADNYGVWMGLLDENSYYEIYHKRASYEGGEVIVDEIDEVHTNINKRNELVNKSTELSTSTSWGETAHAYKELMDEWKSLRNFNLPYQQKIWEFFKTPMDEFYAALEENHANVKAVKENLVDQARAMLEAEDLDQATKAIKDLQKQWKEAGSAGHETDEELWKSFREACDAFFDKKHEQWANTVLPAQEEAKAKKEALIEEAIQAANLENFKEGSAAFRSLMARWKEAGYAGKVDQKLWDEFNAHQQYFYNKKKAYYDNINKELDEHYEAKKALVEEAKSILSKAEYDHDFSYERTNRMKEINKEWKTIGAAGREREQELWHKLREIMDRYFEIAREYHILKNIG